MNINLVTGGAGFIGSNLINLLLSKGEKVICLDNFSTGSKDNIMNFHEFDNFEFMETNILNPIDIKVDKIWHFACPASPKYYYKNSIETTRICFWVHIIFLSWQEKINANYFLRVQAKFMEIQKKNKKRATLEMLILNVFDLLMLRGKEWLKIYVFSIKKYMILK